MSDTRAGALRAALAAEWTKIVTVRSTPLTVLLTFVASVGVSAFFGVAYRKVFTDMPQEDQDAFDPVLAGFYGLTFGQLALVVFGVLLVGSEYSTGMIRASLAAVPQRGVFYCSKLLTGAAVALLVSSATVFATFFAAQAALGTYGASVSDADVPRAVFGAIVYMTLISVLSMGLATALRSSVLSLGILLPLLFVVSPVLGQVPKVRTVVRYLPDQAGMVMMRVVPQDDPRFGGGVLHFGAGLAVLLGWTAAALLCGYAVLRRRDA